MIINATNAEIINTKDVYLHDEIMLNLKYNRKKKKITMTIRDEFDAKIKYNINFIDIIGFYGTSCDFWGPSPYICDFVYMKKEYQIIIPELKKHGEETPHFEFEINLDDYLETRMTFISGDHLRIACREIIIDEKPSIYNK